MASFEFERPERHAAGQANSPFMADPVHERITSTLRHWVDSHPNPDMPALSLAAMGEFSPRQIYVAVEAGTEVGQFVEVLIVNGVRMHPEGLDGVLRSFTEIEAVDAPSMHSAG